jgi:hypothetical protein
MRSSAVGLQKDVMRFERGRVEQLVEGERTGDRRDTHVCRYNYFSIVPVL